MVVLLELTRFRSVSERVSKTLDASVSVKPNSNWTIVDTICRSISATTLGLYSVNSKGKVVIITVILNVKVKAEGQTNALKVKCVWNNNIFSVSIIL